MRARRGWTAVVLAATAGVAGFGPLVVTATTRPAWAFVAPVKIIDGNKGGATHDFEYSPNTTRIFVGDGVTWVNQTDSKHTITSDPGDERWDSDEVAPGDRFERRFKEAGRYVYRCKIHPKMTGVIEVVDESATTTTTAPTTTTTAAPSTTTTTEAPTTTTTEPPTTTTTGRPPAAVTPPPVPVTAAAPPPTLATSSTTTVPSSTTTTAPPTTTSAPPTTVAEAAPPGTAPPTTGDPTTTTGEEPGDDDATALGPTGRDAGADPATVALVGALVAVGLFGAWTLIRVRPGRL